MNLQTSLAPMIPADPSISLEQPSRDTYWLCALLAAFLLVMFVGPRGFLGGGWDDWQYLNAARCWREFGPCLPSDHWQGRWPVIVPLAASIALLGESRSTVSLSPLIASVACLLLLAHLGNRIFGRPIGWIASLLLVLTPAFSIQLLTPRVESIELAFILAAVLAIVNWRDGRQWYWPLLAGLAFGMAFQVRETAVVAAAFAAIYVVTRTPRPSGPNVMLAIAGFAAPFLVELLVFAVSTGDPFWRRKLSIAHTQVISSELLGPVDPNRPPFFNKTYIANWRHESGLDVHWAFDGLINLFLNAKAGLSFVLAPLLLLIGPPYLQASVRKIAARLWLWAIAYAAVLIYALAIDPKARMMLVPLCATHLALALLIWHLKQAGRTAVVAAVCIACAVCGLVALFTQQSTALFERPAEKWIAALPGQIEIDPNTRRHLTLVQSARALPGLNSDSRYLLYSGQTTCGRWIIANGMPEDLFTVVAEAPRSRSAILGPDWSGSLCLFRYERQVPASQVRAAMFLSRPDGPYILAPRKAYGAPE